ncbi:MAG: hypothetical protein HY791_01375 [Deltaproteobacteria bacterium]|nr:hypothetical protein [Deltaproteobacteria bacterium]
MPSIGPAGPNPNVNAAQPTTPAAPPSTTGPASTSGAPDSTIAAGLAAAAPAIPSGQPGAVIAELAKSEQGKKIVDMIKTPTAKTSLSAKYNLGGYQGRQLEQGEEILLELPKELRGKAVRTVILRHRQEPSQDSGVTPGDKHDSKPGLTAVHLHSTDLPANQAWRHWNGPWGASGPEGAKFAEPRSSGDPENEIEFDWHIRGHSGVDGGGASTKKLQVDAIRVRSLGDDPVFVHMVEVQMLPPKADKYAEVAFCEGTKIGDPETGAGKKLTGGQSYGGKFPGALELPSGGAGVGKLPQGWAFKNGRLEVDLEPGKRLTGIDVACGDSFPDGKTNKDGGTGTPGWAKMYMSLQKAGGGTDQFMTDQGVPPEGVLSGAPTDGEYVTKPGDKFILSNSGSTLYLMAVRLGYKD